MCRGACTQWRCFTTLTFVACALAPYAAQALSGYCHQCQLGFFVVIIKLACGIAAVVVKPAGALMHSCFMLHHSMPTYLQRRITFYVKCTLAWLTASSNVQAGFGLAFCIAAIMCSVVGATTIATGACLS